MNADAKEPEVDFDAVLEAVEAYGKAKADAAARGHTHDRYEVEVNLHEATAALKGALDGYVQGQVRIVLAQEREAGLLRRLDRLEEELRELAQKGGGRQLGGGKVGW
jgi:malonyl CoA-acyl carrier protein transacylase